MGEPGSAAAGRDHEALVPDLRDLTLDLCACARSADPDLVAAVLLACPGTEQVHVDAFVTWALATFDPTRTSPRSIVEHMASAGFEVRVARLFDPDSPVPSAPVPGAPLRPRPPTPSSTPTEENR